MPRAIRTWPSRTAAAAAMLVATAGLAHAAATLDYRGTALSRRQVEAAMAPALRAPADSAATARGLEAILARMQNAGYLDARASAAWDSADGAPRVSLRIVEGERFRLTAIEMQAASPEDSVRFLQALGLTPGGYASPAGLAAAVQAAVGRLSDHGRPYAELGVTGFEWDSAGARVRLNGALGPEVTITRVRIDGLVATRPAIAKRAIGRLEGTRFDRPAAEAARERLVQLGLFRRVSYEGIEGESDWTKAQLVYRVEEPRYNRFEGAVGFQGEGSAVGLARLELDNLAGTGRAAALRWESKGQGIAWFSARYAEPMLFGAPWRGEVAVEQQVQDTIFTRTRWGGRLGFALSRQERLEAGYQLERVVQPEGLLERAELQTTTFGLERDARDEPVWPRRGMRVHLSGGQSFKSEALRPSGRRTARASTFEGQAEWHRALNANSGLSVELHSAARFSSQRVLPIFERFPVGGAASLRGHDEEAFRVDRYLLTRAEWRLFPPVGRQRVALFWDHAVMASRLAIETGGDRQSIENADGFGFGLRLEAPGGLVGLDYGLEPGRAPLEGKIHLQLVTTF